MYLTDFSENEMHIRGIFIQVTQYTSMYSEIRYNILK